MKVKVYSLPGCSWCVRAKEFLRENNIDFEEINIAEDKKAALEMVRKSGQDAVPVIEIGKQIIVGFNEPELRKALKLR